MRPPALDAEDDVPTFGVPAPKPSGGIHAILGADPGGLASMFATSTPKDDLSPVKLIGCFRLVAEIAKGGFGSVWLAEQTEPVRRDVALKLILPGMASAEIVSRFERERQALAMMEHDNIAKVFEAGEHEGRLFFAMEYVPGLPITKYVKDNGLTLQQRIELFIPICQAVHHAHQKFVLHRDLKPANILVTQKNGRPVPKVIDFGIAKPLTEDHRMSEADSGFGPVTLAGDRIGTPQYMSPEQARGADDIDAASDTYTLGIILYELLVGEPPVTASELFKIKDAHGRLEHVAQFEPTLPSTLWLQATTARTRSFDASLGADPRRISRQMRGDLDWIVHKALEKERGLRYASAEKLADDLQRYLDHEPVSVGPPSLGYHVRKFYLRHRTASIAAGIVLMSIIIGGGAATWQWREALMAKAKESTARQKAETAQASEAVARKHAETSQLLAEAREREAKQARDLEAKARALAEEQRRKAERAGEMEARARSASDLARAEAEDLISFMLYDLRDRLEPLNRTALLSTVAERAEHYFSAQAATIGDNGQQTRNRAAMYQNKGLIELAQNKLDEALASFTAFFKIASARVATATNGEEVQSDLALAHNRLGMVQQARGDVAAAQHEYEQEQQIVLSLLQQKPEATAWRLHLATTHEHLGDLAEHPLLNFQQAHAVLEKLHAEQPESVEVTRALATAHEKLGIALRGQRKLAEALAQFDQQLQLIESLPAALVADVRLRRAKAVALQNKASTLLLDKRADAALPVLEAAVNESRSIAEFDPGNQVHLADLASAEELLATCHGEQGRALLQQGTAASIKAGLQALLGGRDALQSSIAHTKGDAAARKEKLRSIEQAVAEAERLGR